MLKEIGSEFCLESITDKSDNKLSKWLLKFGNIVLTTSGRGAIALLLKTIKPKLNTVLLPSYICESVILSFIEQGYICYFYDINKDLSPNIESIISYGDIGIFFHMGYYGFPTNSNLTDIISYLKSRSTIIIEDITHTLFSNYKRFEENDYYVASIRKWFGVPSGGLLASPSSIIKSNLRKNDDFTYIRRQALLIKSKYIISGDETLKPLYLALFAKAEKLLDEDIEPYDIDDLSRRIISTIDIDELIRKRKENFKTLAGNLNDLNKVESIFTNMPEDICPIFYPVLIINNRNEIREILINKKIYCPIHWPMPSRIKINYFKNSQQVYKTILSIPCDQRYNGRDMERVVSILKEL